MKVAETLERALSIQREIWNGIAGQLTITDTRQPLLLECLGIALEHHEAIMCWCGTTCGDRRCRWYDSCSRFSRLRNLVGQL